MRVCRTLCDVGGHGDLERNRFTPDRVGRVAGEQTDPASVHVDCTSGGREPGVEVDPHVRWRRISVARADQLRLIEVVDSGLSEDSLNEICQTTFLT